MDLVLPKSSLVVLIGVSGAGKSTFAARHFRPTEVLSSDRFRALLSDDENDQNVTADAFDVLHYIAGKRLAAGRLTVVDATNVKAEDRAALVALAKQHHLPAVAIVLDLPQRLIQQRTAERQDRDLGPDVTRRQADHLRRTLPELDCEGFSRIHLLHSPEEVDRARVVREPLPSDLRERTGPFDVIGDVHGCRPELESLLGELGYSLVRDADGRAVDAMPPAGRTAVFAGDLVDRGPDTPGVLRLAMGMVAAGHALVVSGNHEYKLIRALDGGKVKLTHGLEKTMSQLGEWDEKFRAEVRDFCAGMVDHYVLDGGNLVVAHAGLPEPYHGRTGGRVRSFALYGDTTGERDEYGLPIRLPWQNDYRGEATVLYGHTPAREHEWTNNTLCLDTGCVFGGRLTALRYPERELVSVPAEQTYHEPKRPFG
ncbi:hypothetical protein D5S17_27700 [Pseudonocardiaceae bacterium YIM PH 21723]|nr:hypothetical protein D5S17_27700 [Pseudonocardiaceae bacterium YIM PH 21723]